MVQYFDNSLQEKLVSLLQSYEIDLGKATRDKLFAYMEELHNFNEHTNLTAIRNPEDSLILNLVDSLLYVKVIKDYIERDSEKLLWYQNFIDIGSGGGLPAFPLAISLGCSLSCVESVKKKARFLSETANHLGLTIEVYDERVELLSSLDIHRSRYQVATARALDSLPVLLEYASPLLSLQGIAVFSKANIEENEFLQGQRAAELLGMKLCDSQEFLLPNNKGYRKLLVYIKDSEPEIALPRPVGRAHKRPLG